MPLRLIPQIHRATHRIGLHIERLGAPGVTQAEAHILAHLVSADHATVADLHRAFGHKRSTLTSILDRLERRRLVMRTVDERDRRTFVVALTPRGRTLARRVATHLRSLEGRALSGVSSRDLAAFRRVLAAFEGGIDRR